MRKHFIGAFVLLCAINFSCKNELTNDNSNNDNGSLTAGVVDSGDRVDNSDNGKPVTQKVENTQKTKQNKKEVIKPPLVMPFFYNGKVRSPENADTKQQANGVLYDGSQYAYIAYGTKDASNIGDIESDGTVTEASYHGYVDVLDMSDPDNVKIIKTVEVKDIDFYQLALNDTALFVAGAANKDKWNEANPNHELNSGAVLLSFNLSKLQTPEIDVPFTLTDVPSSVTKDVAVRGDKLAVISGSEGGYVMEYNLADNMAIAENLPITDGRAVGINSGGNVYWMAGDQLTKLGGVSVPVSMDDNVGAQRLIGFYQGIYPMVSLGKNGVAVFSEDLTTSHGEIANVKNNYTNIDIDQEANAVTSFRDSFIVIAEGSNGVMFHRVNPISGGGYSEHLSNPVSSLYYPCKGGIILEGSPNDVYATNDYLFVASGVNGMTVLKYETAHDSYYKTPSHDLVYDENTMDQWIGDGSYWGLISSDHNYETHYGTNIHFGGIIDIRGTFTITKNAMVTMNIYGDFTGDEIFDTKLSSINIEKGGYLRSASTEVRGDILSYGQAELKNDALIDGSIFQYGGQISLYNNSVIDGTLILQKNNAGNPATFQPQSGTSVPHAVITVRDSAGSGSIIGNGCKVRFASGRTNTIFEKDLTIGTNAYFYSKPGFTKDTITVNGTLYTNGSWKIKADKGDIIIRAREFTGYKPDTSEGSAGWDDIFQKIED